MGKIVSGHQPHYFPPLHYFARVQQADVFFLHDEVQFSRGSAQHRVPLGEGKQGWLTIPVRNTGIDTTIADARIDMATPWPLRHIETLVKRYGEAARELTPFYERLCSPVIDPDTLRTAPDRFATAETEPYLKTWIRLDEEWRAQRTEVRDLHVEKRRLAGEIGRRKRTDPASSIDELVMAAETAGRHLESVSETYRTLTKRRNRLLLTISRAFGIPDSGDEFPMAKRWALEGVDPGWSGDVKLVALTIPLLEELFERFEINTTIVRSSELPIERGDDPSIYLARLTDYLGGDSFLSGGVGYTNYLDETPFEARGLDVLVQDWTPSWEGGNVCALDVIYESEDPPQCVR